MGAARSRRCLPFSNTSGDFAFRAIQNVIAFRYICDCLVFSVYLECIEGVDVHHKRPAIPADVLSCSVRGIGAARLRCNEIMFVEWQIGTSVLAP